MRRTLISLAVLPVLAVPAGALAAAKPKPKSPSPSTLLLTRADLGKGWSVDTPAPAKVPPVGCSALHLKLRGGAAHPAAAAGPTFRQSTSGPFLSQTAYEYSTGSQQRQVWSGVARRALLTCLAESFVHGSTGSVQFTVTGKRVISIPGVRVKTAGYRVTATATRGGNETNSYLDVILVANGTGLSEVSISSLLTPPPSTLERRVARLVASALS